MNNWSRKQKTILLASASAIGLLTVGGSILYTHLPKMPLKSYTAACLYLAVMDDEIARNELEGNRVDGETIVFPPKMESLQYRYRLFLEMNRKLSTAEMDAEIQKFETRLEESKQHIGQAKQELKSQFDKTKP